MNEISFSVQYTENIVKNAVYKFMRYRAFNQKSIWIVTLILFITLCYLLYSGDRSWLMGVIGAIMLLPPLMFVIVWRAHYVNTVGKFHRFKSPEATFTFSDDGVAVSSELGSGLIAWGNITEIWIFSKYWMLFIGSNQFNTFPTQNISNEEYKIIREKISVLPHTKITDFTQ